MPLATIWRDASLITDKRAVIIRDVVHLAVQNALTVKPGEVEVRVRDIGPLDINYKPIGIEIDTGTGKGRWRVDQKAHIAIELAKMIDFADILEPEWIGPDKSYVWIRICESMFVPVGHVDHAR